MFKLAHISDIHLAPMPEPRLLELVSKRLTGYINWKKNRAGAHRSETLDLVVESLLASKPDHLALTGDMVNLSTGEEVSKATQWLGNLSQRLAKGADLSLILGNHDAYVPGALQNSLNQWQKFFGTQAQDGITPASFPLLRRMDNVSIISCNSAEATLPFMATGYFRADQAERLSRLLQQEKDQFRVVLIHHPPIEGSTANYKRLIGAERFAQCLREYGAELVLHGHTHLDTINFLDSASLQVPVVCVPAAANAPGGPKPAGGYNLFEISGEKGKWHCGLQSFGLVENNGGLEIAENRSVELF